MVGSGPSMSVASGGWAGGRGSGPVRAPGAGGYAASGTAVRATREMKWSRSR
jgi:hypothetical protein